MLRQETRKYLPHAVPRSTLSTLHEERDISYAYQTIQLGVYVGGMAEYNIIYKTYSRENVTGSLRTQARCNTGPLCI